MSRGETAALAVSVSICGPLVWHCECSLEAPLPWISSTAWRHVLRRCAGTNIHWNAVPPQRHHKWAPFSCFVWWLLEAGAALPDVALFVFVSYGTPRSPPRLFSVTVCPEDTQVLGEVWRQHPPAEERGVGCCPASFLYISHKSPNCLNKTITWTMKNLGSWWRIKLKNIWIKYIWNVLTNDIIAYESNIFVAYFNSNLTHVLVD